MTSAAGTHVVRTNTQKQSLVCLNIPAITFQQLWDNFATGTPYTDAKTGKPPPGFENQCAIRMSVTLHRVGINMKSFAGKAISLNGKKAALLAKDLAAWLDKKPFCGLPLKSENITGESWEKYIKGKNGIVFFENYWRRAGEKNSHPTGSHIDLWNGSRLTASGFVDGLATFGRYVGIRTLFGGTEYGYSDLGGSTRILFWEIK